METDDDGEKCSTLVHHSDDDSSQMEDLPNELLLKFFNFLDSPNLQNCRLVSKRLNTVASELIGKTLKTNGIKLTSEQLEPFLSCYANRKNGEFPIPFTKVVLCLELIPEAIKMFLNFLREQWNCESGSHVQDLTIYLQHGSKQCPMNELLKSFPEGTKEQIVIDELSQLKVLDILPFCCLKNQKRHRHPTCDRPGPSWGWSSELNYFIFISNETFQCTLPSLEHLKIPIFNSEPIEDGSISITKITRKLRHFITKIVSFSPLLREVTFRVQLSNSYKTHQQQIARIDKTLLSLVDSNINKLNLDLCLELEFNQEIEKEDVTENEIDECYEGELYISSNLQIILDKYSYLTVTKLHMDVKFMYQLDDEHFEEIRNILQCISNTLEFLNLEMKTDRFYPKYVKYNGGASYYLPPLPKLRYLNYNYTEDDTTHGSVQIHHPPSDLVVELKLELNHFNHWNNAFVIWNNVEKLSLINLDYYYEKESEDDKQRYFRGECYEHQFTYYFPALKDLSIFIDFRKIGEGDLDLKYLLLLQHTFELKTLSRLCLHLEKIESWHPRSNNDNEEEAKFGLKLIDIMTGLKNSSGAYKVFRHAKQVEQNSPTILESLLNKIKSRRQQSLISLTSLKEVELVMPFIDDIIVNLSLLMMHPLDKLILQDKNVSPDSVQLLKKYHIQYKPYRNTKGIPHCEHCGRGGEWF